MILSVIGKIKSISFIDQSISIDDAIDYDVKTYFYQSDLFKNKDWLYPSILGRDVLDFKVDGSVIADVLPYDHEF